MVTKSKVEPINEGNNPYFPHKLRGDFDLSVSNRFTGNRNWNYTPNGSTHLPDPRSEYVSKWNRI